MSGIISTMDFSLPAHQSGIYKVETPVYTGPLDLLLQLIERAELDITRLALAQITDQYLAHLHEIQNRSAAEVSAFLVIAAKLIQIKSEVLLPRPPVREAGEEDLGEALARQLRIYKLFKESASFLAEREERGLRTYLRLAAPPKIEAHLEMDGLDLAVLLSAAQVIYAGDQQSQEDESLGAVAAGPRVTIREKIQLITDLLHRKGNFNFRQTVENARSRLEVMVTFLALLELVKRHFILARQERIFGDIEIERVESWDESEEFELEFGE